jgi:NADH:ubiquinone reductase (H+-translocating)
MRASNRSSPRVVILGAGFGGLAAAKRLSYTGAQVVLIDRTNHHLFQPLLYQVATGALASANISMPLRTLFRQKKNVQIFMSEIRGIDLEKKVVIGGEREFPYDRLIVAIGARHAYFGHPEWAEFAPGLKTLADAEAIRHRIFSAFETAELASDPEIRRAALNFVIVGAGPTGVEMAGAMAEIAFTALQRDYRSIDPSTARLILVDALDRVLPTFHPEISRKAHRRLEELGIEVRLGSMVQEVNADGAQAGEEFIPARTVIWAAGNEVSSLLKDAGFPVDKAGRVEVAEDLTVPGHPEVQVIGDAAVFPHQTGKPLPALAAVAIQQGRHAAWNLRIEMKGMRYRPFHYSDRGSMATIGRRTAVADLHVIRINGHLAWLTWAAVHLAYLKGGHNRILVTLRWLWSFFSFEKEARLIKTPEPPPARKHPEPRAPRHK